MAKKKETEVVEEAASAEQREANDAKYGHLKAYQAASDSEKDDFEAVLAANPSMLSDDSPEPEGESARVTVAEPVGPSFDEVVKTPTPLHEDVDHSAVKPEIAAQHLSTPPHVPGLVEGAVSSEH